jgi:nucleotide-binding universal stress UspA family protein
LVIEATVTAPVAPAREHFLQHLLVAADGSENGARAVSFALALALHQESEIEFCYAVDHATAMAESCAAQGGNVLVAPLMKALDDMAASIVGEARSRATAKGIVTTGDVLDGSPVSAIVERETTHHYDAIVMGAHNRPGLAGPFYGNTVDGVLRRTVVPTFVVPASAGSAGPDFDRILVALDDSDPSDAAYAFALAFARSEQSRLVLCSVAETGDAFDQAAYVTNPAPMLEELERAATALLATPATRAREANVPYESVVAAGDPASQILNVAQSRGAGLIVIGTHGRRGLRRWIVGSVAESVVRRSTIPVVVVRGALPSHGPKA